MIAPQRLGPVEYGLTAGGIGAKMAVKLSDDAQLQVGGEWKLDGQRSAGVRLRIRF